MPAPIRRIRRGKSDTLAATAAIPAPLRERLQPLCLARVFYQALEASRSACPRTGWGPQHLIAKRGGEIVGVVPCYLKSHSRGEYVFDRGWADAYERAGGRYYPKLQVSVPFTPATGPRLLVREDVDRDADPRAARQGTDGAVPDGEGLFVHVTFAREEEWKLLAQNGFLQRTDKQFHWENQGYASFDDFLGDAEFAPPQADQARAARGGRQRHHHRAADRQARSTEAAFDAFFRFYMETGSRKWGSPYLTRDFYSRVGETMADDMLLVMAKRNGRWIAGAINFIGSRDAVRPPLGRGRASPVPAFRGLLLSGHRLRHLSAACNASRPARRASTSWRAATCRPTTFSAHYIPDPGFRHAVADYLKRERRMSRTRSMSSPNTRRSAKAR